MMEESSQHSRFEASRMVLKNRNASKLSLFETNMENFSKNQKFNLEKIDPKGVQALSIYASFSGVIEDARLFSNTDHTLQLTYKVFMGPEWHDETPEVDVSIATIRTRRASPISANPGTAKSPSVSALTSWPPACTSPPGPR